MPTRKWPSSAAVVRSLAAVAIALPIVAHGAVLDVPVQYPTIQAAVDAAGAGDVIRVAPGTYQERVRIRDERAGLTIEALDPAVPPVIAGTPNKSSDGVRVDRVDGIVLRNLRIEGAYNGVRLNRVTGAVLENLTIRDSALGIRLNNGAGHAILGARIVGTRVEQGIWIDGSSRALVADAVVEDTDEEGIAARNAPGLVVLRTRVFGSRGSDAIRVHRTPGAWIEGCTADASAHDGVRVSDSPGLVLRGCTANGNRSAGFRIEESSPIATIADVLAAGNTASGNGGADVLVDPARCNANRCPTVTTLLPVTTTTSSTTTTRPPASTTTTRPLPPTTSTTIPSTAARWRLYVRLAMADGRLRNADVPAHGGPALEVTLATPALAAFSPGDRVYLDELTALDATLPSHFAAAAERWIRTRPTIYPGVTTVTVLWVQRVP